MATIPTLSVRTLWECPACHGQTTTAGQFKQPGHQCPSLSGLQIPYAPVPAGMTSLPSGSVRVVPVERMDMIDGERGIVHDDAGRAIMAVRTERADGSNDVTVYAPVATNRKGQ